MQRSPDRRQFLGSTALAGLALTAGCLSVVSTSRPADEGSTATTPDGEMGTPGDESTPAARSCDETTTDATQLSQPDSVDDWLADANGYDGDPARPGSRATIQVGEPTDGEFSFAPAVIEVAPMTRVTWEWTGHGRHNVVALDGTFDSGRTNAQSGTAYEYTFTETGEYPFASEPHLDAGMKGAVIVREPPSTGNETVDRWLRDVDNFDGELADRTDAETATIQAGAAGNGGHFAFDPPALKVSAGTTVEWEWNGEGGAHNVVFLNADIHSGEVRAEPGVHFEHTFEESGTYRYACQPHRALGQKGAIVVE